MTHELKPWLDQNVPPELRRLLEAARSDEPSFEPLQRAIALVAVATAASDVASTSTLSTGSVASSTIVGTKWFFLGGGVLGMIAVGAAVVGRPQENAPSSARPIVATAFIRQTDIPSPAGSIALAAEEQSQPEVERVVAPTLPAKPTRPRLSVTAAPVDTLSVDAPLPVATLRIDTPPPSEKESNSVSLDVAPIPSTTVAPKESQSSFVDRARIALKGGQYAETLAILNQYELAYQTRTFAPEAMQLRMRANLRMGNNAVAKQIAEALVTRYPSTPQGKDARELLEK